MYDKHDAAKSKAIVPLKGPIPNQYDDRHDGISAQNFKDAVGKSDRTAAVPWEKLAPETTVTEQAEINTDMGGATAEPANPTPIDPANPPDEDEIKPSAEGFSAPPVSTQPNMGSVPIEPYFRWQ